MATTTLRPEQTADGWSGAAEGYDFIPFSISYSADALRKTFENRTAIEVEKQWNEPLRGNMLCIYMHIRTHACITMYYRFVWNCTPVHTHAKYIHTFLCSPGRCHRHRRFVDSTCRRDASKWLSRIGNSNRFRTCHDPSSKRESICKESNKYPMPSHGRSGWYTVGVRSSSSRSYHADLLSHSCVVCMYVESGCWRWELSLRFLCIWCHVHARHQQSPKRNAPSAQKRRESSDIDMDTQSLL